MLDLKQSADEIRALERMITDSTQEDKSEEVKHFLNIIGETPRLMEEVTS